MKRNNKVRGIGATGALCLACLMGGLVTNQARAITAEWDGGGGADTDWYTFSNWAADVPPTNTKDIAKISVASPVVTYSGGTNANLNAVNLLSGDMNISGGSFQAYSTYPYASHIGGTAGQVATLNQTGGTAQFQNLEIGYGNGFEGVYNISGGDVIVSGASRMSLYSVFLGRTDTGSGAGIGTMEVSGGTFTTRQGVQVGGEGTLDGIGIFSVLGAGATRIDIGGYTPDNMQGGWYQYEDSSLKLGISADGITPIQVSGGNALFQKNALIDVAFLDGHLETNMWTVMTVDGVITDGGLAFASGVDTNLWNMGVTNETSLWVSYGMGGFSQSTNTPPPSPGRTLYWTGLGGTTDSQDKDNWATDTDGTPATWGIYDDDIWFIGSSDIIEDTETISVVDYDSGSPIIYQERLELGRGRTGVLNFNGGEVRFTSSSVNTIGGTDENGDGTLNFNDGVMWMGRIRVGADGAQGTLNIDGGALTISSSWDNAADGRDGGIYLGYGSTGTGSGTINVVSGSLTTRRGISLGVLGDPGTFCVQGSEASAINIGSLNTIDGYWYQSAGSVLKARIDEGGITPIFIDDKGSAGGYDGNAYFEEGALLDVDFMPGVANYGVFDVMTWEGDLVDSGLQLAPSVDSSMWDFMFVDTDGDTTNDKLRVIAPKGTTPNGTPVWWLYSQGLTEADDAGDPDGDGMLSWEEYVAGTSPTNSSSVLAVNSFSQVGDDLVISWQSVEGKSYSVVTNTDLLLGTPGVEASGITGLPTATSYTSTVSGASTVFFEIDVE